MPYCAVAANNGEERMKKEREKQATQVVATSVVLVAFFAFAIIGSHFAGASPFDLLSVGFGFVLGMCVSGLIWICSIMIERAKKRVI
jgi:hypothetical protein